MEIYRKGIRALDHTVNILIAVCLFLLLSYGVYGIWDSNQIYKQADASQFETYKPLSEDKMSFEALKKINPEVFGWITVKGTNIDYPLVQSSNNSKYVNTDVKGSFSLIGSIFLDSRNQKDFSDMNNVIYGHNMEKKAMFGGLKEFEKNEFFEKHKYGKLYYDDTWHKVEFFAFLYADAYDPVLYDTGLYGSENYRHYLEYVKQQAIQFRTLSNQSNENNKKFVALSTCTSSSTNGRHLLIGRIMEQTKEGGRN